MNSVLRIHYTNVYNFMVSFVLLPLVRDQTFHDLNGRACGRAGTPTLARVLI
jgi:hypothetical protein